MMFGFLFWLFFIGIAVACLQDLKRREVDNWLNLFLLATSFIFIFYKAIFENDAAIVFQAGFALVIMFALMNVFYYGRVFAGGDAKLLVAMTVFFIGANFNVTLINIGIFLLFLMFSGSVYGLIYSLVLYIKDYKKVNREIKRGFDILWVRYMIVAGIVMFVLSYVNWLFLVLAVFMFLLPVLYVFAKGLESVSMVKNISGKDLKEGDWLAGDVVVGSRQSGVGGRESVVGSRWSVVGGRQVIRADWDGLSLEDIELLKGRKSVKIKEGLPFVPAFLIAFFLYIFLRDWVILIFIG